MKDSIELSVLLDETNENLYNAWLDSDEHSRFTGSRAVINPKVKGKFSAWDGYITGITISSDPYYKIVQFWRTTDFSEKDEDSVLELYFEKINNKTRLTLKHKNIPEGQGEEYRKGWQDFYFTPMKKYFSKEKKK
jgi:activator of HSP90 ATPase